MIATVHRSWRILVCWAIVPRQDEDRTAEEIDERPEAQWQAAAKKKERTSTGKSPVKLKRLMVVRP